jgi:hypothetical protein
MLGGASPVSRSNPTGVGTGINYVRAKDKTLAFAYSGEVLVDQSTPKLLSFTTGSETITGKVQFNYYDTAGDNDVVWTLNINGELVQSVYQNQAFTPFFNEIYIVIPPYSIVTFTGFNVSSNTGRKCAASITGEVF